MQHDDDLDREPDYSGSGLGPDDEDSRTVTHSRNNKNNFGGKYPKHNKNQSGHHDEDLDGSGDSALPDIRDENDDDEDNRFGHTSVKLPKPVQPTVVSTPKPRGNNDDLHIEDIVKPDEDLDLDGHGPDNEDEDEEEDGDDDDDDDDEDPDDVGGVGEDDYGVDKKDPKHPTHTDDEDLESQCMAYFLPFYLFGFLFDFFVASVKSYNRANESRRRNLEESPSVALLRR